MSSIYSSGVVTAYGAAKAAGYTGTYSQFCQKMADIAAFLGITASASTLPAGSSATASYNNSTGALSLGIPMGIPGDVANIADDYSPSKPYSVDEYAIYSNQLYRCITPIETPETWTAAHWKSVPLGDDVFETWGDLLFTNDLSCDMEHVFTSADFESGSWGYTTKVANSKRIRTKRLIPVTIGCRVFYNNPSMDILIGVFSTRKETTYAQYTGWISAGSNSALTINANGFMAIMFESTNNIAPSDYDSTVRLVTVPYRQLGAPAYDASTDTIVGEISAQNGGLVRRYNSGADAEYAMSSFWAEAQLAKYATFANTNILPIFGNIDSPSTLNGITYTWKDYKTIHVEGTASATSYYNLIISRHVLIPGIVPGDDVLFKIKGAPDGVYGQVFLYENGSDTWTDTRYSPRTMIVRIPENSTGQFFRLGVSSGTAIQDGGVDVEVELIVKPRIKHLRVLLIGNSYTNDCSAYAPLIAEGLSQNVAITLGTTYYSGASIDDYIGWFDNDSAVLTYYKYNALAGKYDTALTSRTLKQCIANEPWDIICFQQASSTQGTWTSFSNLNTLIDKVLTYNASVHTKAVRVGWMFPQLRYSLIGTVTYANCVTCIENLLNTTPVDFFFPCGTAVQNARGTSLDSLGAYGHLTADSNGHLQAGLPSLLASYVTALKLIELAGEPWHGILQETTRPTQDWIAAINSPGENGTSTGVTDANCYLAQKCAVAAIKFPTTVSTIS